jgi:hypothetical protein
MHMHDLLAPCRKHLNHAREDVLRLSESETTPEVKHQLNKLLTSITECLAAAGGVAPRSKLPGE